MGRIKTALIKRVSNNLMEEKKEQFRKDFDSNKKVVDELLDVRSKKIRNIVAGYITRLNKEKKNKPKPRYKKSEDRVSGGDRKWKRTTRRPQ